MLIELLKLTFYLFVALIWIRLILSFSFGEERFYMQRRHNPLFGFIYSFTEPVLKPFRKMLPSSTQIDTSPIIAIISFEIVLNTIIKFHGVIFK
ncbi:MAG: YggT family protein [Candidatus Sericytochromatia bacterium]